MIRRTVGRILSWLRVIDKPELTIATKLDMPGHEELVSGQAVIVGPKERPKWVTFPCPCDCGTPLLLSLNPDRRPRWSISCDWFGRPDISPSVRRTDGCECHFWVRKGRIEWCKDSGGAFRQN